MEDHIGYYLGEEYIKKEEGDVELKTESPRINEISRLQCHVCYKVMGHRSSLYKHLKYVHKIEPAHRLPISCREKDCYQSFTFIDPFRRHLAEQHGFNIVVEKYVFQSMSDFFSWKKVTEEQENLRFIVSTGPRNSKGGKTHYYRCQKNGAYKPEIKKRLQSDDRESIYNISTTHCISSMFVFEEPDCVTVEFCRTHYGHEVSNRGKLLSLYAKTSAYGIPSQKMFISPLTLNSISAIKPKIEVFDESYSNTQTNQHINYQIIDSNSKLNSYLSEKDKTALINILKENQHLLKETEELFYENEQDVILKIPYNVLKSLMEERACKVEKVDYDEVDNEEGETAAKATTTTTEGDASCDEAPTEGEQTDNENSTILKSLGNGIFLDPSSNKRLKLDSFKKKTKCKEKKQFPPDTPDQNEPKRKDKDSKNNTVLVKEYLNEYDEKVYVLELMKQEETVVQKREKILSQLQTILVMVNSEEDMEVLDDIQTHLSKYAVPE